MMCFGGGSTDKNGESGNTSMIRKQNQEYYKKKKSMELPKNIEKYFSNLEESINPSKGGKKKSSQNIPTQDQPLANINQNFLKKFRKLSKVEQNRYMLELLDGIQSHIKQNEQKQKQNQQKDSESNNEMEDHFSDHICQSTHCLQSQAKMSQTNMLGMKKWKDIILKLHKDKKKIIIKQKNDLFNIPLRSYVLRKKQVKRKLLVIESTNVHQQNQLMKFSFQLNDDAKYQSFYEGILEVIVNAQVQKLIVEYNFRRKMQKLNNPKKNKLKVYLNKKHVEDGKKFIGFYQNICQKQQNRKVHKQIYRNQDNGHNIAIYQSKFKGDEGKWFVSEMTILDQHQPNEINFLQVYSCTHKLLKKFKVLEKLIDEQDTKDDDQYGKAIYGAIYQKLKILEEQQNQKDHPKSMYSQELLIQKQRYQHQQIFNIVSLDHTLNDNFIQYLRVQLKEESQQQYKNKAFHLTIQGKFSQKFSKKEIVQYLKEFLQMFQRLKIHHKNQNSSQIQIGQQNNSKFYIQNDLISRFDDQVQSLDNLKNHPLMNSFNTKFSNIEATADGCLRVTHRQVPTEYKVGRLMREHLLYRQWERVPRGGLKCTNYELVAFQKSLFKAVMKKFGEMILKGQNIVNFSLPVVCFKKQSHLKSLANTMLYCPLYLQKAARIKDPLERMKYSVILMVAIGLLSVQSQKPFNPIIGQTYQCYVDGCPVYLQQISHHPPISAYYMQGRGYKMYGTVDPQISISLNSATGYSDRPHIIEFEDGTVMEMIFAKMIIYGMIAGDREFIFDGKIYAFDKTHNFFTELTFGPINRGLFTSNTEPRDYLHGKIYTVTDQFKERFEKSKPRVYPQKGDILKEHLMFDGIWNGAVFMEGQQIINLKTQMPYQQVQETYPLPSDCRYRPDLIKLTEDDKEAAQIQKQILQDLQRKDKKLRQQGEKQRKKDTKEKKNDDKMKRKNTLDSNQ